MDFPGKSPGVGCHCLLRINYEVPSFLRCQDKSSMCKVCKIMQLGDKEELQTANPKKLKDCTFQTSLKVRKELKICSDI